MVIRSPIRGLTIGAAVLATLVAGCAALRPPVRSVSIQRTAHGIAHIEDPCRHEARQGQHLRNMRGQPGAVVRLDRAVQGDVHLVADGGTHISTSPIRAEALTARPSSTE